MALAFYMDHHVERSITIGLRLRGVDVLTAYEDGGDRLEDADLLDRTTNLRRVLFTRDEDFLVEAAQRQMQGTFFYGVIYAHKVRVSIGKCINDLAILAKSGVPDDVVNQLKYLPL